MKERSQIVDENPIERLMEADGIHLIKTITGFKAKCPFHEDKNPSMSIDQSKGLFHCHGCKASGSVIDYVARRDGTSVKSAMEKLGGEIIPPTPQKTGKSSVAAIYSYRDESGQELYQALRMEPKSFRQRYMKDGSWVWNMTGVRRVLYNLPLILKANNPYVWIVEGEKDCDNLKKLGFVATTNVGGAGKWLEGYSDSLKGKELILCGDNDEPGRAHMAKVLESVCKKAKTVRQIQIPEPHKDVSDYIKSLPGDNESIAKELFQLVESAVVLTGGVVVPVQTMAELEREYQDFIVECKTSMLDLGRWLPTLGRNIRGLVPGELVVLMADTGVGKTGCLQNLAIKAAPIPTLLFELELPGTLTFERFASIATKTPSRDIFTSYHQGSTVDWRRGGTLDHITVCSKSRLTPMEIESIIVQTELKTGNRPKLVLLDYIGLVQGAGKGRYERMSNVAEELKVIAKSTKTIIIVASQVSRNKDDENPEITLHDAKDSGSIENSAGLVLGMWRDSSDPTCIKVKVLKSTKGGAGITVDCNMDGPTMTITERSKYDN